MNKRTRKFSKDKTKELNNGSGRLPSLFDTEAKPINKDRQQLSESNQENTQKDTNGDDRASRSEVNEDKEQTF